MKRFVSALVVTALVASPLQAWGQQPQASPVATTAPSAPVPPPIVSPLKAGQSSPWSGVLLSPGAVAQIVAEHDSIPMSVQLAVQHQQEIDAAQQKFQLDTQKSTDDADKAIVQAQLTDAQTQSSVLQKQLNSAAGGPGAGFWIGLGAVGGIVVTVATVFALSRATK